jgi:DNA-directed RNA polymerase specialized sigma24 family protein
VVRAIERRILDRQPTRVRRPAQARPGVPAARQAAALLDGADGPRPIIDPDLVENDLRQPKDKEKPPDGEEIGMYDQDRQVKIKIRVNSPTSMNLELHYFAPDKVKEILKLVVEGLSTKQIADKLFLGEETIKSHRKNLMAKLNQPTKFWMNTDPPATRTTMSVTSSFGRRPFGSG